MSLFMASMEPLLLYLLVLARLLGIIFLFPFFSWRGVPVLLRVWLAMMTALLIFLSLEEREAFISPGALETVFILLKEVLTGLALGYLTLLFFSLFINAGQLIDISAGLNISTIFDPHSGYQVTYWGQFYYLLAVVFYLTVNGHHIFLKALAESYRAIPLGSGLFGQAAAEGLLRIFADILVISFQIVAPVVIILMLVDIALGLVDKTVPQVQVFIEGIPLKIALALLLVAALLPAMGTVFETLLGRFMRFFEQFMLGW